MEKEKFKVVCQWIREQSRILPYETYTAYHKELEFKNGKVERVGIEEEEHDVNHYRRIKRLYKKFGLEGINYYFLKYGYILKNRQL